MEPGDLKSPVFLDLDLARRDLAPVDVGHAVDDPHPGARVPDLRQAQADVFAPAVVGPVVPQLRQGLGPNDPREKISPDIAFCSTDTLIVGYLPFLWRLASLLLL